MSSAPLHAMRTACSALLATALTLPLILVAEANAASTDASKARYLDNNAGHDWPGYGRTFGEQHYSPLEQINETTVGRLSLAWSLDLEPLKNTATEPIEVDGVLYFATGLSVVNAVDAVTGKQLWRYDPQTSTQSGLALRHAWGVKGIAWWNGRIYVGTADGRLIAVDAKSGSEKWSVRTFPPGYQASINSAPRVFDGKVIIGYANSNETPARGYVTTYDAETGRQLWRFYTIPGDPSKGFENPAMAMAAKTWAGEWWKIGGGGDVWNSIAYDAQTDTVFIGTGNAHPQDRRERSADQGDNLFVASIVALEGKTGTYRWHYQATPGDTWDYDSVMDIQLADLKINGQVRKVLVHAPKNGFFYVIDRLTGKLLSAEPYAKVTWASRIDLETGRPVEVAGARDLEHMKLWPSGIGAHSWMPMAHSPKSGLVYIPRIEYGVGSDTLLGTLLAWDPVKQRAAWSVPHPTYLNGGVLATGGNLVFQGTVDGLFKAYSATTGKLEWSFDAHAPLISNAITYSVNGHQYLTLLTGLGMGVVAQGTGILGTKMDSFGIDPRSQARRVLTFALDGKATLPPQPPIPKPPADSGFVANPSSAAAGKDTFYRTCSHCHGVAAIASAQAPDLRRSSIPLSAEAFDHLVRSGIVPSGMPAFPELTDKELADVRQYLRTQAHDLRQRTSSATSR